MGTYFTNLTAEYVCVSFMSKHKIQKRNFHRKNEANTTSLYLVIFLIAHKLRMLTSTVLYLNNTVSISDSIPKVLGIILKL